MKFKAIQALGRERRAIDLISKIMVQNVNDLTGFECPTLSEFEREYLCDFKPSQVQKNLMEHLGVRFVAVVAGRRSGKTYWGGRGFLRRIYRDVEKKKREGKTWTRPKKLNETTKPFCDYWCISPTYDLGSLQKQEIFEVLGGDQSDLILDYNAGKSTLWLRGGVRIQFKSGNNPLRLVGSGLDGVWDDESARQKPSTWQDSIRPTLADKQGWAIFTTTPLGKNWFFEQIWEATQHGNGKRDENFHGAHFTTADNTAIPHLVAEVELARQQLPAAVFARNYLASFEAFEGKIYTDFMDDSVHVVQHLPYLIQKWAGGDWGHTNFGTQIVNAVDRFGNIYVVHEDFVKGLIIPPPPKDLSADCWINRFKTQKNKGATHIWCDPSQPANIAMCQSHGVDARAANNAVEPGIDLLQCLLKPVRNNMNQLTPSLFFHGPSTVQLRGEMSSYRRDDKGKIMKQNDHGCDALRYGIYSESINGTALTRHIEKLKTNFPSLFTF